MKVRLKTHCKGIVRLAIIFASVVVFCTLFKVFACSLSSERVKRNIENSRILIQINGDYPAVPAVNNSWEWRDRGMTIIDYYTEWMVINAAYNVDSDHPLKSAMQNDKVVLDYTSTQKNLLYAIDNENVDEYMTDSVQYWMGSLSIIRILLYFFDYSQVIILFQCMFFISLGCCCISIYKKCGNKVFIPFLVSLLSVYVLTTSFMFHYGIVFIISFISIIYTCNKCNKLSDMYSVLLVSGMLTAYFDWMSTPSVSCTLPLVVMILITYDKEITVKNWIKRLFEIVKCGICWCIGYAGMQFSKWIISAIVLDTNVWDIVRMRILADTGVPDGVNAAEFYLDTLNKSFDMFITGKLGMQWVWIIVAVVIIIGILINIYLKSNTIKGCLEITILAIVPFAWSRVFMWFTNEHYWFTYRNFLITIFVIFVIANILWSPVVEKVRNSCSQVNNK